MQVFLYLPGQDLFGISSRAWAIYSRWFCAGAFKCLLNGPKSINNNCEYLYGPMCLPGEAKFTPLKEGVDRNL